MSYLKHLGISAFGLAAAACTTGSEGDADVNFGCVMTGLCSAYAQADPESAGPEWSVRPVRTLIGDGVTWATGDLEAGDTIRVHWIEFGRHAVLEEALNPRETNYASLDIPRFEVGTLFYPVSFRSGPNIPLSITDRALNIEVVTPTSWCTVHRADNADQEIAYCMFYRNTEEYAVRISNTGSAWHIPRLSEAAAMREGQVQLRVVNEPLGRELQYSLVLDRIRRNRVTVTEYIDDGVTRAEIGRETFRTQNGFIRIPGADGHRLFLIQEGENGYVLTHLDGTAGTD